MTTKSRDSHTESSGVAMDMMSLFRLMVRHWRVTGPAAAVTLLMVVAAFLLSSPTYAADASVALFNPPNAPASAESAGAASAVGQNPYTRYGDLSVVADLVARKMASSDEQAKLEARGVADYKVVANRLERGPLVEVTGIGPSPEAAISSAKVVVKELDSVLEKDQLSQGADPHYLITSSAVEAPDKAVAQVGSTLRTAIAALAVGGLGILGLAALAEAISRRRSPAGVATATTEATADGAATRAGTAQDRPSASADLRPAPNGGDPVEDRPGGRSGGGGRAVAPDGGDPVEDRPGGRSGGGGRAVAPDAGDPAKDRQRRRAGAGRAATPKVGARDAAARPDAPIGSPLSAPWDGMVRVDRQAAEQQDWTRWLPPGDKPASGNGHNKRKTDRSQ